MKIRLDLKIDSKINEKFRKKFIRKKGDLSRIIEELMLNKLEEKKYWI